MKKLIYKKSRPGSMEEHLYILLLFRNFRRLSKYYIASHTTIYRGLDKMYELAVTEDELWQ